MIKELKDLNRDEIHLLMFVETQAVDYSGRVFSDSINSEDIAVLEKWNQEKFIESGRICLEDCKNGRNRWIKLSSDAFRLAGEARQARANRLWEKRQFKSSKE